MRTGFMKRMVPGAAATVALLLAGTAQAALQDRDLDGNGQTDAFYDTDLNITWLRETRLSNNGAPGNLLTWHDALAWAENFSFAGYDDWRLPKGDPTCYGAGCIGSEMGHLWYVELGNSAGPITNSGSFFWSSNPAAGYHWSSTFAFGTEFQVFEMYLGGQASRSYISTDLAMAVRDGDVPAIPEPATCALMLAGLVALTVAKRRQRN